MTRTFFKDRRTGTVYVTTEKTFPASGSVPLKAAYKEDTVWIDRTHLDKVRDPHEMTTGRAWVQFFLLVLVSAVWFFLSFQTSRNVNISLSDALWLQGGWAILSLLVVLRNSGSVHG